MNHAIFPAAGTGPATQAGDRPRREESTMTKLRSHIFEDRKRDDSGEWPARLVVMLDRRAALRLITELASALSGEDETLDVSLMGTLTEEPEEAS